MTYNAIIELDCPATPRRANALVDALVGYHPAASASAHGLLDVVISLPGESLRQAAKDALALVELVTTIKPRTIEIVSIDDFDRL